MQQRYRQINGLVLLDKPVGVSSNKALQQTKRLFRAKKAGHTGSLDVLASGLLPICLGEATKFSQFFLNADKRYTVTACLGKATTTCDAEGELIAEKPFAHITRAMIEHILSQFRGQVAQTPSMFSAIKYQGRPLYTLARQGITVPRKVRQIQIYELQLSHLHSPYVDLIVHCSKGTYIRNLIDDIGKALGCGAYVSALRRISVGRYDAKQMYDLSHLTTVGDQAILPIADMLSDYPSIILSAAQIDLLYQGKTITVDDSTSITAAEVIVLQSTQGVIGIGKLSAAGILSVRRLLQRPNYAFYSSK